MVVVLLLMGCQRYAADLVAGVARFRDPNWHVVAVTGGAAEGAAPRWKHVSAAAEGEGGQDDPRGAVSMLRLAAPDTYAGLAEKVFAALREVRAHFGAALRGVFKTDDDIAFDPPAAELARFLAVRGGHAVAWAGVRTALARAGGVAEARLRGRGHRGALPPPEALRYPATVYCYGAGYWLRADRIDALLRECPSPPCVLEDVSVGIAMNRLNEVPLRLGDVTYRELPRAAGPLV
jgi:hypothetical protein